MARKPAAAADAIKSRIRAAGLRCTPARVAVLQYMMASDGPESHAEVAAALADKGFDRATIYRNLTELTEADIVARIELGDHVWRFEIRRHGRSGVKGEDHPHFICTSCGEVSCLEDIDVAITPRRGTSKAADAKSRRVRSVTEVLLKGQCENCG